jgi:hypothetical protein
MKLSETPRRPWSSLFAVAALLLMSACSAAPSAPVGDVIDLTLRDFHIDVATALASPGPVVLRVHNDAPVTHELVVVRTDLPAAGLPIGSDGISVDEETLDTIDEISDLPAKTGQTLTLDLSAGHYVFFCNLEGHYLGGMHGVLEVTPGA